MARTDPTLLKFARERRKNPTHTEKMLWQMLRARKRDGIKFRREAPVEGYIADFYCAEHKLIIEIDGDIHELPDKKANDAKRQEKLEAAGYTVLRFSSDEVYAFMDQVIEKILDACSKLPSPTEGGRGEGGEGPHPNPLP
jgi:very-short-patch-repair endonuclease